MPRPMIIVTVQGGIVSNVSALHLTEPADLVVIDFDTQDEEETYVVNDLGEKANLDVSTIPETTQPEEFHVLLDTLKQHFDMGDV